MSEILSVEAASVRLLSAESVLILTHVKPDGDAVGSVLGMQSFLRSCGKRAEAYFPDPLPAAYGVFGEPGMDGDPQVRSGAWDLILLLDCANPERAGVGPAGLELLRSYFNTINTARASLLERTEFYYAPIRTMGYAEFKGTNAEVESRSLDITMGFRLYVQDYVANSADNKDAIMNNVLSIVDSHLATGSISTTRLAEEIRESLSDTVQYVENLGINGDPELRILILNESMEECIPHLKQELYLDEANQIKVNRGVTLEYVSID